MAIPDARSRLVVACLRVVDQDPAVDPLTGEVRRVGAAARASDSDLAALEHALRIAEAWSGRVLALALGPPAADAVLREAVAVGADSMRVAWRGSSVEATERHRPGPTASDDLLDDLPCYIADLAGDTQPVARALANAIRTFGQPSLILCGARSGDRGTGELPAWLAHEFKAAQALGLVHLAASRDHLVADRRLDRGGRERLHVPMPAVCSVEAAGVTLRRAGMRAALAAAGATIPVFECEAPASTARVTLGMPRARRPRVRVRPAPAGGARDRLLALTGALVDREHPMVVGPLDAGEAAEQLLAYLRRHGYVVEEQWGQP